MKWFVTFGSVAVGALAVANGWAVSTVRRNDVAASTVRVVSAPAAAQVQRYGIAPARPFLPLTVNDDAGLLFCDEFNTLNLRSAGGTWDTSYFWQGKPNGSTFPDEQQWYLDADFGPTQSVRTLEPANGLLSVTARRTPPAIADYTEGHPYVSGVITSGRTFKQTFGYFEMRAMLPAGQGLWPAFWLVPGDMTASHEIDVMEAIGSDPRHVHTTFHQFVGGHRQQTKVTEVADMTKGYHLFGADWQADKITWYFDRKPVFSVATPADLHKPMFMIANLAAGGGMPGPVGADTVLPASMKIDYIRVYARLPTASASSLPAPGLAACPVTAPGTASMTRQMNP